MYMVCSKKAIGLFNITLGETLSSTGQSNLEREFKSTITTG